MNKINGTYKFKTVVTSQMIITVSQVKQESPSSDLEFSIKIWLLNGEKIIQTVPLQTIRYEGLTAGELASTVNKYRRGEPPIVTILSNDYITVVHYWAEYDEVLVTHHYKSAAILLKINGNKIISKGYEILSGAANYYPLESGSIGENKTFLLLTENVFILTVENDSLSVNSSSLNMPLVKTIQFPGGQGWLSWQFRLTSSRLSANTIIVFYHYSLAFNMQICVQVVKISETNNFTVSSMQFLPGRAEGTGMYYSTAIGSSRISDNECFFSYDVVPGIKKVGRIVTVNGNSVAWGSEVELINSNEIRVPGFVDLLGCQILSFSNSNNFIVVYLRRRGHEGVLIMELLAQSVKIQGSTISPQNIITIAESNDMDEIPWSSFIPLFKDIPTSSGSIFVIISSLRNPFYYKVLTMTGNDITASDKYMPEQDEHFFQIASDIYNWYYQKSSFGNTALIPPLKT
jgi:hypothetical protein